MLQIKLTSGLVAKKETQCKVVRALGLRKYGSTVLHADTPTIRGMINKVHHLVTVTEVAGEGKKAAAKEPKKAKAKTAES